MNEATFVPLAEYRYRPAKAWTWWNKHNKVYLTDGHMLLRRKYVKGILQRMKSEVGHAGIAKKPIPVKPESMKRIMRGWNPTFQRAEISDTVRCPKNRWHPSTVTVYRNDGENHHKATLCADKVALILKKVPNATFYLANEKPESSPVWIKSGRAVVGCVMPVRV